MPPKGEEGRKKDTRTGADNTLDYSTATTLVEVDDDDEEEGEPEAEEQTSKGKERATNLSPEQELFLRQWRRKSEVEAEEEDLIWVPSPPPHGPPMPSDPELLKRERREMLRRDMMADDKRDRDLYLGVVSQLPYGIEPLPVRQKPYDDQPDWTLPNRGLAPDPQLCGALRPVRGSRPGGAGGAGVGSSAGAAGAVATPEGPRQDARRRIATAPTSSRTASGTSGSNSTRTTPRRRPPPPANAAHLPKQVSSEKGPYYIPQSTPEASMEKANPAAGASSTEGAAAQQDPGAKSRAPPGMVPPAWRQRPGEGSRASPASSDEFVFVPSAIGGKPLPSAEMGIGAPTIPPVTGSDVSLRRYSEEEAHARERADEDPLGLDRPWYVGLWTDFKAYSRHVAGLFWGTYDDGEPEVPETWMHR